jgi:hypothetical protein
MLGQDESGEDLEQFAEEFGITGGTAGAGYDVSTWEQGPLTAAPQAAGGNMYGQDDGDDNSIPLESVDTSDISQEAANTYVPGYGATDVIPYLTDESGNPISTAIVNNPSYDPAYSEIVNATAQAAGINPSMVVVDSNGDPIGYTDPDGNQVTINSDGSITTTNPLTGTSVNSAGPGTAGQSTLGSLLSALSGGSGGASSSKSSVPTQSQSGASTGLSSLGSALTSSPILMLGIAILGIWALSSFSGSGRR